MRIPQLTPREQVTLQAIARRLTNPEIAAELHVSVRTVESHVASLRRKLQAESRSELVAAAAAYLGRPVPVPTDSFRGRTELMTKVTALLVDRRWVTLTGPAGVGKTRLALQLARERPSVFVDVEASEPGGVVGAIAAALGVDAAPPGEQISSCASALASGRMQLVLDGADRVGEDVAATLRDLVSRVESLRIIITSRAPLHVSDEVVVPVDPLDVSGPGAAGVRLFLDRCADAASSIARDDLHTVVEVCTRLDGIPLAIELAAARTRHLQLPELARRLADSFASLGMQVGSNRAQRTLGSALGVSWDLLDDHLRFVLRHLAALPRDFDFDLAAAAVGEPVDADVLELLDRSLVARSAEGSGPARFRVLGSLREFVKDRSSDELQGRVARRHALHHRDDAAAIAVRARMDDGPTTRALAKRTAPQIAAALAWAIDNDQAIASELAVASAICIEQYGGGAGVMDTLVEAVQDERLRAAWSGPQLAALGRAIAYQRIDLLEALAARARELAEAGADDAGLAAAQLTGSASLLRGHPQEALLHLDEAIRRAAAADSRWEYADSLQLRARALRRAGGTPPAELLAAFEQARMAYAAAGDSMHANNTRYMMALVAGQDSTTRGQAIAWADQCLAYAQRRENDTEIDHALLARAEAGAVTAGDDVLEATRLFRRVGDLRCLTRSLIRASVVRDELREERLLEAVDVAAASHDADGYSHAVRALSSWLSAHGRDDEASALLGASLSTAERSHPAASG